MTRVNKSWMAAVAAVLLIGTLAGVVWARPNERPGAAEITRKVTLGAADFSNSYGPDTQYSTHGGEYAQCASTNCVLVAPVVFPCLPAVTVERIRLHADDQNASASAGVHLFRVNPSTGAHDYLGGAGTPIGASDGRETYTSFSLNKVVWPSQRAYVRLWFEGPNIFVYGVTVEYHRNI